MIMANVACYLGDYIMTLLLNSLSSNHEFVDELKLGPLIFLEVFESVNLEYVILVWDHIALPVLLCYEVALIKVIEIQRS
jgi:hypothetical protein